MRWIDESKGRPNAEWAYNAPGRHGDVESRETRQESGVGTVSSTVKAPADTPP